MESDFNADKTNDFPERETMQRALRGDVEAFEEVIALYGRRLYAVAFGVLGNAAEAEDVVQETMISVAKHMPNFTYDQSAGSFKGWLLNLTRWRITDQIRKRGLLTVEPFSAEPITNLYPLSPGERAADPLAMPASQTLDQLWDAEWQLNLLEAAVKKVKLLLDPQKYQVFDFYVNKNWPAEKVAATFGISVSQVYLAKHRVTEMIAAEVKKLEQQPG